MPTGVKELHPTCPEDLLTGKLLIENKTFYIFFWTLIEEFLVLKPKMPAGLAKLHSVYPENSSKKNRTFVGKFSWKPFSDCRRQMFGRMQKKRLTGVSNLQCICPDDRFDKKTFFLLESLYFSSSFD